jgi:lysophospholipase L1-like esterase
MSLTAKLILSPLLIAQAMQTRRRMPSLPEAAGPRFGEVGRGQRWRLLVLGDSSAAGVGVSSQAQALAQPLAKLLASEAGVRVQWGLLAQSGLTSAQTLELLRRSAQNLRDTWGDGSPAPGPGVLAVDLAVVVTGVNDVVEQVPTRHAVGAREALVNHLRNAHGVRHVVFAPLPPVNQFPGLPQPLRWVAGTDARRHDAAVAHWASQREDVSHVAMDLRLNRGVMAADGYHPGEPVYRQSAAALARHLARHVLPRLD